ncbi:MAG: alpha/beta hydrolase [Pontixanthobacter sp.]
MSFAGLSHNTGKFNGITQHYVTVGEGPLILLLHGFPYTWIAWRHQIAALAAAGYRVIAPDLRGFGGSEAPQDAASYTLLDCAADIIALTEAEGGDSVTIIGHDLGAWVACAAARLRPDLFVQLGMIGTAIAPREAVSPAEGWAALEDKMGGVFYHRYFQQAGLADAQFDADPARALRGIYHAISGQAQDDERWRLFIMPGEVALDTMPDPGRLPEWLPEEIFAEYVAAFACTGFTPALNHYRCRISSWERTADWAGQQIIQKTLFVGGAHDPAMPLMQPTIDNLEQTYPNVSRKILLPGIGHGVPEEAPEALSNALIAWLVGD